MNRRTAIAIAAATITTLGTGAVTAAAMSGTDVLGLGRDDARLEIVAPTTSTDDNSPPSTTSNQTRRSSDDTSTTSSTTTSTTAPTTTRVGDDNPDRSTSTTTRTTTPGPASPANTATFRSVGGEVDVAWTARTLAIVAVRPAAGFRAENEEGDGDEVEAEFESASHNSKITVRLVNGAPSVNVRERDDSDRAGDDNSNTGDDDRNDDNSGHGGSGRG